MSIALNNNGVSYIRNLWIGSFTGMAGMSLHWNAGYDYALWQSHFPQIAAFLAPYNFNESSGNVKGWMPGHDYDKTHSGSGLSRYGVSDLFYLRSPDNENAVGVIANRTYNFYTQWSCDGAVFPNLSDSVDFFKSGTLADSIDDGLYMHPRISDFSDEHINVKNLSGYPTKRYVIEYYNAWNPTVVIKTETKRNDNWNGLRLEFPVTTGTNARPIVLFKIRPYKNKSGEQLDEDNQFKLYPLKNNFPFFIKDTSFEQTESVRVYPNPATNQITVAMPNNTSTTTIQIFDFSGRLLIVKESDDKLILVNIEALNSGPYILTVLYKNESQHFKIIKQ